MKKITAIVLLVIFMAVCPAQSYAAAKVPIHPDPNPITLDPIARPDPLLAVKPLSVPTSVEDMTQATWWDLNFPWADNILAPNGARIFYRVMHTYEGPNLTVLEGNGLNIVLVGTFYYDEEQGLVMPYGEDNWYISIRLRMTDSGYILYGYIEGEPVDGIEIQGPVTDGNSDACMYLDFYYDLHDEEMLYGIPYVVIVPDYYAGTHPDIYITAINVLTFLPGQDGREFWFGYTQRALVDYYIYRGEIYTRVTAVHENHPDQVIWLKGQFLYWASGHYMSAEGVDLRLEYDAFNGRFVLSAGGIARIKCTYFYDGETYWVGATGIVIQPTGGETISLLSLEGDPLIMY